jgi:hypothetical protein
MPDDLRDVLDKLKDEIKDEIKDEVKDEVKELKTQIDKIDEVVHRHDKYVYVIIALAVIFGLSGGWGLKSLLEMGNSLLEMRKTLTKTHADLNIFAHMCFKVKQHYCRYKNHH